MKKIYIAGCGGMLGEAFYHQFKSNYILKCTDKDVNESWISELDFRNLENYKKDVVKFQPDYLFHLGAYTNLEFCEENIKDTYLTNTTSVENAVYISNELNIPLLYISTAGIFDGLKMKYNDWDKPNPMGHYAKSKYYGELFVQENSNKFLICRAGWMMGGGIKKDKKFIGKLLKQIKQGAKKLNIVTDKDGTPTYTHDFAKNVKLLIENEYWGLYNMVCHGQTSRFEVASELVSILNMDNIITINPVTSEFFAKEYFADRPPCERLVNEKLGLRDIDIMQDWKKALKEYIADYFSGFIIENEK